MFIPDSKKVLILSKAHALMARDEKTRSMTDEGEVPKKHQYLVIMELKYEETDEMRDKHSLGVFAELTRSVCVGCVAGKGFCWYRPERLWYQYHHWTEDRLGIDWPSTLGVCTWAPGGKTLNCGVQQKIHKQQAVKFERTIKEQTLTIDRGVKRDCTEGRSISFQPHLAREKQGPLPKRFTKQRTETFNQLIREHNEQSNP